ncbi:translation initiation factor eIF-2B subunit epsilon isoform X2 [Eurytemora carolleeae]|uniref:translation initiation factor eIF-2B subunit epsilon isoform X2 n=1 Tax=Eurytemora carolleeae TaxID=1294199 RepID=UPI000C764BB9|nr:translation initiation factor eIF-2B subunit epsilon isoform X2 [Eurytemora carolleeae]|eukprot:XP_023342344.1 translation initiation factor eIF-2B subunit epsilon-like isoform X2 [Eurytemora affinis]
MDTMISEILESELVDSTIYLQVLDSGFACRAENPYLYRKLFEKILNRWAYPLVPERNRSTQGDQICVQTKSVYKSSGATVSRGTLLGKDTFIGNRVVLEECIKIHGSDLEEGVRVSKNSTISDSVLMKNCKVGENCVLVNCLVGENVIIPANCSIAEKVILGHGVELDLGASIPSGVRLSAEKRSDGFSDDETEGDEEKGEYGPKAHVYTDEEEEEEEDNDEEENCVEDKWGRIYESSSESDNDEDDEDGDGDWDDDDDEELEEEQDGIAEHHDVKNFRREVRESLLRGSKEGVITDNLVLEINSSKHAWNTTLCEVNQCVLECVLTLELDIDLPPAKLLQAVKVNINKFKQLLLKYSKSKSGQDYYLTGVEDILVRFPNLIEIIAKVLHLLYELDILGEDSILAWSNNLQNTNLKKKIQPFLEWLEEDDSSDEESD